MPFRLRRDAPVALFAMACAAAIASPEKKNWFDDPYLQGCVPSRALALRLQQAARAVPDVELVVDDLMIGTRGKPPYAVVSP